MNLYDKTIIWSGIFAFVIMLFAFYAVTPPKKGASIKTPLCATWYSYEDGETGRVCL